MSMTTAWNSIPRRTKSTRWASTWNISFLGRQSMRSNWPLAIMVSKTLKPEASSWDRLKPMSMMA